MSCASHCQSHAPDTASSVELASYAEFIAAAKAQKEPQRLLWVLAKAELPNGYTDSQYALFKQGQGGALAPVLCVDKLPEEVADFSVLVAESAQTGVDWDIAFVGSLAGRAGIAPNSDEADQPLRLMLRQIEAGMIADFLTFDRQGQLVRLV
ncbi:MAG TPA: ribonucleotide reductase subunit alpha [Rheinheimera sp.]|nr:ribonucleotide reductase subunit alpha [Rheinheimera sp.]